MHLPKNVHMYIDNFNKGMLLYKKKIKNLRDNTAVDLLRRRRRDYMPHPAQILYIHVISMQRQLGIGNSIDLIVSI